MTLRPGQGLGPIQLQHKDSVGVSTRGGAQYDLQEDV